MVVSLGPGKFYGSSLPRPRFYTDVKFNDERVDPPAPVLDPLLSWAQEAHWSMGGLSFARLRLQGKIEGNVQRLKKEKEKIWKKNAQIETPVSDLKKKGSVNGGNKGKKRDNLMDSPPPAPISKKRRQILLDEEDDDGVEFDSDQVDERENEGVRKRRRLVRKLGDDFDSVANEKGKSQEAEGVGVALRTRSRRSMVIDEEDDESGGVRSKAVKKNRKERKSEKLNEGKGYVSPKPASKKNDGRKGSVSPANGTRSSPRIKQKSS